MTAYKTKAQARQLLVGLVCLQVAVGTRLHKRIVIFICFMYNKNEYIFIKYIGVANMANFNYEKYQEALLKSESIEDCDKVPLPQISEEQDYIFISYSHRDYKQVYSDLAYMYAAGVRFWYDSGLTAGKDWYTEAADKILNPRCSGVVFYLSENLFLSRAVMKEISVTLGKDENGQQAGEKHNYFCVNLTGLSPSSILLYATSKISEEDRVKMGYDSKWIGTLMTAFSDDATYVNFSTKEHERALIDQIRNNFNVIDTSGGENQDGEYEGEMLDGRRNGYGTCKYENGSFYEGHWRDNKFHGKGKFVYSEGDSRKFFDGLYENK